MAALTDLPDYQSNQGFPIPQFSVVKNYTMAGSATLLLFGGVLAINYIVVSVYIDCKDASGTVIALQDIAGNNIFWYTASGVRFLSLPMIMFPLGNQNGLQLKNMTGTAMTSQDLISVFYA